MVTKGRVVLIGVQWVGGWVWIRVSGSEERGGRGRKDLRGVGEDCLVSKELERMLKGEKIGVGYVE